MKWVNSREIVKTWGVSRQRIYQIAHQENWRRKDGNRPYWYNLQDVEDYIRNLNHSARSKEMGLTFRGLLRHDENGFNNKCLVCREAKVLVNTIKGD